MERLRPQLSSSGLGMTDFCEEALGDTAEIITLQRINRTHGRGLKASGQVPQRNAAFCSPNPL